MPIALRALGSRTGIPLGATWTALIIGQVGLALAALPSTMELAWGHVRPSVLGPGFAVREFLTARVTVDSPDGRNDSSAVHTELVRHIRAELGEHAVTLVSALPGVEPLTLIEVENAGQPIRRYVRANQIDRSFFDLFDVRAVAGRILDSGDFGVAQATVVDQTFVRQVIGDGTALGRRIRPVAAPGREPGPWYEIVGIVPDRPAHASQGRMYVPLRTDAPQPAHLALRAGPDPAATSRRLNAIAATLDPALRLEDVRRLDEVYGEAQLSSNLTSYALAIVTISVLILSAAGLYALMSFTVTLRRREIGIRTALGAPSGRLLAGVFARALWQLAGGVAFGGAVALVLHRTLNIEVEGGWHIPGILPAAAACIMIIGLLAAAGPARRAIRVDPTEALRDG